MAAAERSAGPRLRQALLVLPVGLFAAGLGLGKIVRDCSLTCNVGFHHAPVAILAIAVLTIPLAALALRGERRWGYRRWQAGSLVGGALSLALFRVLAYGLLRGQEAAIAAGVPAAGWGAALRWTYLAFYVWVGALSVVLAVNLYSHLLRLYAPAERLRGVALLAPALAVGGLIGSVAAGQTASWLMKAMGWRYEIVRDNLMLAMAACLLLQLPFVYAIDRRSAPRDGAARSSAPRVAPALPAALKHPLVARIFAVVALGGVADTALKYLFYWLVSVQVDYSQGRTLYFAAFYSWLNAANLVLLALGTGRAIRRLGLALSLASLPFVTAAGAAALAVHLAVSVMYGLRVVENSLRSVLYEPALDRAFVRVPGDLADPGRALLRGVAPRGGEGVGALVVLGLGAHPGFGLRAAAVTLLAVVLAWLGAVIAIRPALRDAASDRA